jgi:rSAM/selenodomain-associated transferase 2
MCDTIPCSLRLWGIFINDNMTISIIIPTYNEAENISRLINYFIVHADKNLTEIIIVDAGSKDNTLSLAGKAGAKAVVSPGKGRATQMNYGASIAHGEIYYFVHADTFPPLSYAEDILQAIKNGFEAGCYRSKFDSAKWLLKINGFFTRFPFLFCRGGDQTLFITKNLFDRLGGFNGNMRIMEDFDMITRIWKVGRFKIIPKTALVSARKYKDNSWWKVQMANKTIVQMYKRGATQEEMITKYKKLLHYRENPPSD